MADDPLLKLAAEVGAALKQCGWMLVLAESCTGGGVAEAVTAIPGSSAWFDRGFVTYSNLSKIEMLGVSPQTLEKHGAVSEPVVLEMARGALGRSRAQVAVAISGIAGPDGGTPDKPVGTVWLAWGMSSGKVVSRLCQFSGDRQQIRWQAVEQALQGLIALTLAPDL